MVTGRAPAIWVTSTTTRAGTPRARATRAATSTWLPVENCTALTQTTVVRSLMASTNDCVRSSVATSGTQRMRMPERSWAASHGYVTLGKSLGTRITSPSAPDSSAAS
jgi:hypothetical protein